MPDRNPIAVLLLAGLTALLVAGCSTPASVKEASTNLTTATKSLGDAYAGDLKELKTRLTKAEEALTVYRVELTQAKASQRALLEQLIATDAALVISRAVTDFDVAAIRLLTVEFDANFQSIYLAKLRPRLDDLENQRNAAESAYNADPVNLELYKQYARAAVLITSVRRQALEDYRSLLLDASGRIQMVRTEFIAEVRTAAGAFATLPDLSTPRDYSALLAPALTFAPASGADPGAGGTTDPAVALSASGVLTQGIDDRAMEIARLTEQINTAGKEIDNYLKTDGWRREILEALLAPFVGELTATAGAGLDKLSANLTSFASDALRLPGLASQVEPLIGKLKPIVEEKIKQAGNQVASAVEEKVRSVEDNARNKLPLQTGKEQP